MTHSKEKPAWTQLPEKGAVCGLCCEPIYTDEEYEVIKHKNPRPTTYVHTACIKKEVTKR